jgi:hypothetical protein
MHFHSSSKDPEVERPLCTLRCSIVITSGMCTLAAAQFSDLHRTADTVALHQGSSDGMPGGQPDSQWGRVVQTLAQSTIKIRMLATAS